MNDHSIRDMLECAQVSGISRLTIAKYFNDPSSVRKAKREQIERALAVHHYRPNLFAVNLNRRQPRVIGMFVPDLADPFFARVVEKREAHCNASGYLLIGLSSRGDRPGRRPPFRRCCPLRMAGAIVAPLGRNSQVSVIHSLQARIPLVFFDSRLDDADPFVGTDNQSVALITEYGGESRPEQVRLASTLVMRASA